MSQFIDTPALYKQYASENAPNIFSIGYNDFTVVAPLKCYRIQEFWTLHLVLSGRGIFFTEKKQYNISAGQAFITFPDTKMMYYPDENDPWEYMWFSFSGENTVAKDLGTDESNPVCAGSIMHLLPEIKKLLVRAQNNTESIFLVQSLFYSALDSLIKTRQAGSRGAMEMISAGFCTPDFSIESLCARCGVSHAKLCRDFKVLAGTTPQKFLEKCRIDYACRLLKNTDLTVNEVAYSCGYSDSAHFMKTFKKITSLTCTEFRKK